MISRRVIPPNRVALSTGCGTGAQRIKGRQYGFLGPLWLRLYLAN